MEAVVIDSPEIKEKAISLAKQIVEMLRSDDPTKGVYSMYVVAIVIEGQR